MEDLNIDINELSNRIKNKAAELREHIDNILENSKPNFTDEEN